MKALGIFVNSLLNSGRSVFISESHLRPVTLNNLSVEDAKSLVDILHGLGLDFSITDAVEQSLGMDSFEDGMAPFSVVFQKPLVESGIGFVSNRALSDWLESPDSVGLVLVACAASSFVTESFAVSSWDAGVEGYVANGRKSPARIVRTDGGANAVPVDVRPYLLTENSLEKVQWDDAVFSVWAEVALRVLPCCLASDVISAANEIEFLGKPRVRIKRDAKINSSGLTKASFAGLQMAVKWVYDVEREAELRHSLLVQELSRLIDPDEGLTSVIEKRLSMALDGAKIAYEFGLQEMSKDALKGLSDLRKVVVEETHKSLDNSRQLLLSLAGAAFYALGLIAARMVSKVEPWLISVMAVVGLLYVLSIIFINSRALEQQRAMRSQWRAKLYRFLTAEEYGQLVDGPINRTEFMFRVMMWMAFFLSVISFGFVVYFNQNIAN
ncbi:hypothetical protein [Lysobacter brunescens]|uniref:Uncharacterized protein n=1 Tax=Lysobacter brunescens TaxID=262323 RepID=A0ABW2YCE5_9GAMM